MEAQSMIEMVAKGQSEFDGRPWLSMPKTERDRYMERAKLAIKAMRDPTEAMMNAPANMPFRVVDVQFNQAHYSPRRLEWQAAIDAALNEQEKG